MHAARGSIHQRIQNFLTGFIISEHVEEHADGRFCRLYQGQDARKAVFGRMDKVKVMARDLKYLARQFWFGRFGRHTDEVEVLWHKGKRRGVFIDI